MFTTPLQTRERTIYEAMWAIDTYARVAPGELYAPLFAEGAAPGSTVLDAGCGSGKGALALVSRGYRVTLCDMTASGLITEARPLQFAEACLWNSLKPVAYLAKVWHEASCEVTKPVKGAPPLVSRYDGATFDWIYCTDTLEHLPTELTMLAVSRMLEVAKVGAFFSVTFTPDGCGKWLGEDLHKTVRPFKWWRDALREVGEVTDARDLLGAGVFVVRPCS